MCLNYTMNLMSEQLAARRAAILEAVRTMIVEHGYESVTVRELAAHCKVSVPTLYNQFGGKDQLMAAAIEGYFRSSQRTDELRASQPGYPRLIMVMDQSANELLHQPKYHRRLLAAFASLASTQQVQEMIARALVEVLAQELDVMKTKRQLHAWVASAALAEQMMSACIGISVQWGAGMLADEKLKSYMRYAMGLVVLGVAKGVTQNKLQVLVRDAQQDIHDRLVAASRPLRKTNGGYQHGTNLS